MEEQQLNHMERLFLLHAWGCERCFLVQLEEYQAADNIFAEYAYFSSYADRCVEHARWSNELMPQRFGLCAHSLVMEIASNDGYLLQHFVAAGILCSESSRQRR